MNKRTIDPERLAAFLDGRLDAAARAAVVEELSHADPETLIAFGDAASIVHRSAQPGGSAWPWSRRSVVVGTVALAAAAAFVAVMLPRFLGRAALDQDGAAHYVTLLDSAALAAQPRSLLDAYRGAGGPSTPTRLAVRIGVKITDLGVAIARGQSTASTLAANLAVKCEEIPGGGAAGAAYRQLAEALVAGKRPDANEFRRAAITAEASAGESSTRLGAWIEAARYAAAGRDAAFFASSETRSMLARSASGEGGDRSSMTDVRREAARRNIDWQSLADALDRALKELAN